jgi:hypothetical protein
MANAMGESFRPRVWKALDVGGERLYEVVEIWPRTRGRREAKKRSLVLATSPSAAVEVFARHVYRDIPEQDRPIILGQAIDVLMPKSWWEHGIPVLVDGTWKTESWF